MSRPTESVTSSELQRRISDCLDRSMEADLVITTDKRRRAVLISYPEWTRLKSRTDRIQRRVLREEMRRGS